MVSTYLIGAVATFIFAFPHGIVQRIRMRGWLYGLTLGIAFSFMAAIFVALLWPLALVGYVMHLRGQL